MRVRIIIVATSLVAALASFVLQPAGAADASGLVSDEFNGSSLAQPPWVFVNPLNDASASVSGGALRISVPAGTVHDANLSNTTARVMQPSGDTDFQVEVKFDSPLDSSIDGQGIVVEQTESIYLRFDMFWDNGLNAYAAYIDGATRTQKLNIPFSLGTPMWLRVTRTLVGDTWTFEVSSNGTSWTAVASFSQDLTVSRVGLFVGNYHDTPASAPAHTAVVDYFRSTGSSGGTDTTPPVISGLAVTPSPDSALVTWTTNEPATSIVDYGTTSGYDTQAGSTVLQASHSVTLAPLSPGVGYHYRVTAADAAGNTAATGDLIFTTPSAGAGPLIEVWYGDTQSFGLPGRAQKWVDILGNISDPDGVSTSSFTLNGGSPRSLSRGADGYRLQRAGDFDAQIPITDLAAGPNTVIIRAVDGLGNVSTRTVTVNWMNTSTWPLPYTINWGAVARIGDVAQVVDGRWSRSAAGIRTSETGYDRLVAVGDMAWTDYEVTVPVTVHAINCDPSSICATRDGGAALGLLLRWDGHEADTRFGVPAVPASEPWPFGSFGVYRWNAFGTPRFEILGSPRSENVRAAEVNPRTVSPGQTWVFKMRVETLGSNSHRYSFKAWPGSSLNDPSPGAWDLTDLQGSDGALDPATGSLLLVAHHIDATFGTVQVTSLVPDTTAPVLSNLAVANITTTSATVTWTTNEPATSKVRYGTTTAYGPPVSAPGYVTSHSVTLTGLTPGTLYHYEASSTDPANNTGATPDRTFTTVADVLPAALGNRVWTDANGNGRQDTGESGVAGVTVELYACTGTTALQSKPTNASGIYTFTGLVAGSYKVKFLNPAGTVFTFKDMGSDTGDSDADPGTGFTGCVTLTSGQTNNNVDAGIYTGGSSLGDRVWEDVNGDGIQDAGEPGMAGMTVGLYTCTGTTPLATTSTDGNGTYGFADLATGGSYRVKVTKVAPWKFTSPDQGGDDATDSDVNASGWSPCVSLPAGATTTVDAGLYKPVALGNRVWNDVNVNGRQNTGETGVGSVPVELWACGGGLITSKATTASGTYTFSGLAPGSYQVKFAPPSVWVFTLKDVGPNDTGDSDADPATGFTDCVTLTSGQTNNNVDAGVRSSPT